MTASNLNPGSRKLIVAGYDGSEVALHALEWAAAEADRVGAELLILKALGHEEVADTAPSQALHLRDLVRDSATKSLEQARTKLAEKFPAITIRGEVHGGSPSKVLIQGSEQADLLVVGNRGSGLLKGSLLGSTAFAVTAHANCPVIVVRGDEHRPINDIYPVTVAVDGSDGAWYALETAADWALELGAPLRIITAFQIPNTAQFSTAYVLSLEGADTMVNWAQDQAKALLAEAEERVLRYAPGLKVNAEAHLGPPSVVLIEISKKSGLLVTGARGRGGFASLILGSVSRTVMHQAHCPVLVQKAPAGLTE